MDKKQRDKVIKYSDFMNFADTFGCLIILVFSVGAALDNPSLFWPAVGFIVVGLIRIRMIMRAQRVDALLREAPPCPPQP